MLDLSWQVVAGEESVEVEHDNQREMRVLEAVYPRASAIPLKFVFTGLAHLHSCISVLFQAEIFFSFCAVLMFQWK